MSQQPPYPGSAAPSPQGPASAPPPLPGSGGDVPPGLFNGATVHGIIGQRRIRHPWELPLLGVGVAVTLIGYLIWAILVVMTLVNLIRGEGPTIFTMSTGSGLVSGYLLQIFVIVMILPIVIWISRAMLYAQQRASSVRMSPTQFPEGYRMVADAAQRFGLRRVPDAYVASGSGVLNAFAFGHGFRRSVVVYSDMFEVGGAVRDPEALRFVIGHEVGHLAAGHVSYFRIALSSLLQYVPVLSSAFSRAQEYTADNFGYADSPQGALGAMGVLAGGKYLNADVNLHELADRAASEKGLWVHVVNWRASHPIITWRAHALRDRSRAGHLWLRPGDALWGLFTTPGAWYDGPLPAGSTWSGTYPTPAQALAMLDAADAVRPAGTLGQFGRFNGADYSDRMPMRQLQLSAPLLSTPLLPPPDDGGPGGVGGSARPSGPAGPSGSSGADVPASSRSEGGARTADALSGSGSAPVTSPRAGMRSRGPASSSDAPGYAYGASRSYGADISAQYGSVPGAAPGRGGEVPRTEPTGAAQPSPAPSSPLAPPARPTSPAAPSAAHPYTQGPQDEDPHPNPWGISPRT